MRNLLNGEASGAMNPKGLLAKTIHPLFWTSVEHNLNRLHPFLNTGTFFSHTRVFEAVGGFDGGNVVIETPSLDGSTQRTLTIAYSRDELDGHLGYVNAIRTVVDKQNQQEISGRLQAIPPEFTVIEYNPLFIVSALHEAAKAAN